MHDWFCSGCKRTYAVNELVLHLCKVECPACFQRGLTGLLERLKPFPWRSDRGPHPIEVGQQ